MIGSPLCEAWITVYAWFCPFALINLDTHQSFSWVKKTISGHNRNIVRSSANIIIIILFYEKKQKKKLVKFGTSFVIHIQRKRESYV